MVSVTPASPFFPLNLSPPLSAQHPGQGLCPCMSCGALWASPKVTVKDGLRDLNLTPIWPHRFSISSLQPGHLAALGGISPWHSTGVWMGSAPGAVACSPWGARALQVTANVSGELRCFPACLSSGPANYLPLMDSNMLYHIQADILIMRYSHCWRN